MRYFTRSKLSLMNKIYQEEHANDSYDYYREHEKRMNSNLISKYLLGLLIVFGTGIGLYMFSSRVGFGLSGLPTEAMAKKKIFTEMNEQAKALVDIVSLRKTDGIKQVVFGQEVYKIEYIIKLKFKEDSYRWEALNLGDPGFDFCSKKKMIAMSQSSVSGFTRNTFKEYKQGTTLEQKGSVLFEKTENGWR